MSLSLTPVSPNTIALRSPVLLTHYNTGNSSELVSVMDIATTTGAATNYVVYSQRLDNLRSGEILVALVEAEVTNPEVYNVEIGRGIILAKNASDVIGASGSQEITEANTSNVTPSEHHGVVVKHGSIAVTVTGTRYVNFVMYAAASAASGGDQVLVEQDYGRMTVLRFG